MAKITIESDEGGFALVVDGQVHRIEDPAEFYTATRREMGEWYAGFARGRAARERYDREAYEISDPKHPDYHSVHVDLWDARDVK